MTKKEEQDQLFQNNLKIAIEQAVKPDNRPKIYGWTGILVGIVGIFLSGTALIFAGAIAGGLGAFANNHGQRKLGVICGILGLIDMAAFFIFLGGISLF